MTCMRSRVRDEDDCERTRKITTASTPSTTRAAMVVKMADNINNPYGLLESTAARYLPRIINLLRKR